jgi:hypothetical protein
MLENPSNNRLVAKREENQQEDQEEGQEKIKIPLNEIT